MSLVGDLVITSFDTPTDNKPSDITGLSQNYENLDQTELAEIARTNSTISTSNASQSSHNLDQAQIGISCNGSRGETMTTNEGEVSSSVTVRSLQFFPGPNY